MFPVAAKAGVIAISVAVAAAIAVYESPELRRMAEDLRRKISLAFHSFGDVIEPNSREPLFNRPEDAEGFLQSRGVTDPGVVADEASLRRQREELMYWNAIQLEKQARELQKAQEEAQKAQEETRRRLSETREMQPLQPSQQSSYQPQHLRRGTTFDDFLSPDRSAGAGTFVFNTGSNIRPNDGGLVQRRPLEASRGLQSSVFSNPFSDEHQIMDEQQASYHIMAPTHDELPDRMLQPSPPSGPAMSRGVDMEATSDIYDDVPTPKRRLSMAQAETSVPLVEFNQPEEDVQKSASVTIVSQPRSESPARSVTVGRTPEPAAEELATQGQENVGAAFASIQAWAQSHNANPSFYSPIPVSPAAPLSVTSDLEVISRGDFTPTDTDSLSLAGSGVDIANDVGSRASDNFDVMSDSTGIATPASFSEIGSVISEDDQPMHA